MLTHRNQLVNAAMGAELLPLGPGERVGMLLPLFHANAQIVTCVIPMMIGREVTRCGTAFRHRPSGRRSTSASR